MYSELPDPKVTNDGMGASPAGPPLPEDQLPQAIADRRNNIVLMVGGMRANQAYKGHDQVIQAWPPLASRPFQSPMIWPLLV